jgi:hypothetical protein
MLDFNADYYEPVPNVYLPREQAGDALSTLRRLFPAETFPDHPVNRPGFQPRPPRRGWASTSRPDDEPR